ncbi:hypothetical protein ABW18_07035 [Gordonia jacobaea]|uniref:Uncharacterized protein n=1 Tax=Gordonia jacobaea TaxID=122202 RepID=A0ABR5IE05_9ACTN|nr:hypothetical protein ABW18_07035 [Gordonia jacobaea]
MRADYRSTSSPRTSHDTAADSGDAVALHALDRPQIEVVDRDPLRFGAAHCRHDVAVADGQARLFELTLTGSP